MFGDPDRQVILQFLSGTEDLIITNGTKALEDRARSKGIPSTTVTISGPKLEGIAKDFEYRALLEGIKASIGRLTQDSRVYITGHGSWRYQNIAGCSWREVAELLNIGKLPSRTRVSVIGCQLGRDKSSPGYGLVGNSVNSFGSKLHFGLRQLYGIQVILTAFVHATTDFVQGKMRGRKGVFLQEADDRARHKVAHSKLIFFWQGDTQVRKWVDYANEDVEDVI